MTVLGSCSAHSNCAVVTKTAHPQAEGQAGVMRETAQGFEILKLHYVIRKIVFQHEKMECKGS